MKENKAKKGKKVVVKDLEIKKVKGGMAEEDAKGGGIVVEERRMVGGEKFFPKVTGDQKIFPKVGGVEGFKFNR